MRVVFDGLQAANRSGTGRHVVELVRAMAHLKQRPELHVAWPEHSPHPAEAPGVHYASLKTGQGRRFLAEQYALPRLAARIGAGALHYPANAGLLRRTRCPLVLTVHDCSFARNPAWFRWERAQYHRVAVRRSTRLADHIIVVSQFTADDLMDWLGLPAERIHVIHNGVSPHFRPPTPEAAEGARRRYALPERYFLFVGTLEPRKNLPRLLAAYRRAAEEGLEEELVVVGRIGWKTSVDRLLRDNEHQPGTVRHIGHVPTEDLPALYGAARAFVWPSLFEGFGLPVLEAMACGAAVLTSSTSALPEVAGDAALLVDPKDETALAAAIVRLAREDALVGNLRAKGPKQAARFTWENAARQTVAVYNDA